MSALGDLVRQTLAERAHDVDHVQLNASAPRPGRSRRWVAVGTVVALAAAIVVALVLVAPWRGASNLTARPAVTPSPPAGMRWVSFHGLTFTLPDTWALKPTMCETTSAPVEVVVGPDGGKCAIRIGSGPARVTVTGLDAMPPQGDATVVAGLAARRFDGDGGLVGADYVQYQIPEVDVVVRIGPADANVVDTLTSGIVHTPVDPLGCAARAPSVHGGSSGQLALDGVTAGVVCEYETPGPGAPPQYLLGSRVLTHDDLTTLRTVVATATPAPYAIGGTGRVGADSGLHLYRLTRADGSTETVSVDLSGNPVVVSDGQDVGVLPQGPSDPVDVPNAYP